MTKSPKLEAEKKSSAGKTYYIRAAAISLQLAWLINNYAVIYIHLEDSNFPVSLLISASTSSDQSSNQSANATDKVVEVAGDDGISAVVIEAPVITAGDNIGECHMIT